MRTLTVAVFTFVLAGTTFGLAQQDNPRAAIEAANKQFVAAFLKGDAAAIANMYSADAMAFPPNSDVVKGRAAIQKLWAGAMSGVKGVTLTTVEASGHGDMAHEVGNYEMTDAAGKMLDRGKYIVIWKREGGQWKLYRDIWNTNMPAAK